MSQKTPNIELPELSKSDSPAFESLNDGFRALDVLVQLTVASRSLADPPDVEQGARYIVSDNPSGAWVGHSRHVAYRTAAGWSFRTPRRGWTALVIDEEIGARRVAVYFDGLDWINLIYTNMIDVDAPDPQDGDTLVYDTVSEKWVAEPLTLDELGDVDLSSTPPNTNDTLIYNGALWVPGAAGSSGGNIDANTHPSSPATADDEFEFGSTLDTTGARRASALPWTKTSYNSGVAAESVAQGALQIVSTGTVGPIVYRVAINTPASSWRYRARVAVSNLAGFGNFNQFGLHCYHASSTKWAAIHLLNNSGQTIEFARWTAASFVDAPVTAGVVFGAIVPFIDYMYFEVFYDGVNSLQFGWSRTGYSGTFATLRNEGIGVSGHFSSGQVPDFIGIHIHPSGTAGLRGYVDWLRRF